MNSRLAPNFTGPTADKQVRPQIARTMLPRAQMFTFREKFIASDAWMRICLLASLGLALYTLFRSLDVSVPALRSPLFLLLTVFAAFATIVLTLLLSPFLAFAIFDGVTERQSRRNGGPFSIGDRVVIIAGRFSGRTGIITSYGQCQTLRVTLDADGTEHGSYSHYQLKKTGEPSDARETSTSSVLESESTARSP